MFRDLRAAVETLRARRNEASKSIGKAKASGDEEGAKSLMTEVSKLKATMPEKEAELAACESGIREALLGIPNLPHDSVPVGASEKENKEVRVSGPVPELDFTPLDHASLGEKLGIIDFATAAKLSGSRFAVLEGAGARLHRAIGQFMIDYHVDNHGYRETWVPCIVRPEVCEGTGQLPKFEQDLYKTGQLVEKKDGKDNSDASYLIPTAEVPLTNLVRDEILSADALPIQRTWTADAPPMAAPQLYRRTVVRSFLAWSATSAKLSILLPPVLLTQSGSDQEPSSRRCDQIW